MIDETRSRQVTPGLRRLLKEPLGPLYRNVAEAGLNGAKLVSVGDISSYELIRAGKIPYLAIYDCRKERTAAPKEAIDAIESLQVPVLNVSNRAGTLDAAVWPAVREGLKARCRIKVDGEEDLLVLPVAILADDGTVVCYGQPGKGVVVLVVDGRSRKAAEDIVNGMEELK
jgi:uncharacterized protein (UPF0218 family)